MRVLSLVLALLLSTLSAAPALASDQNDPLADWQWNKRLLVSCMIEEAAFDPDQKAPVYKFIDWTGFDERNLLLVEMRQNSIHTVQHVTIKKDKRVKILIKSENSENDFEERAILNGLTRRLHGDNDNRLRRLASCQKDDEFILIGKDGTVKRVWQNIVPMDELFATIDAMPMRQREMREQGK